MWNEEEEGRLAAGGATKVSQFLEILRERAATVSLPPKNAQNRFHHADFNRFGWRKPLKSLE